MATSEKKKEYLRRYYQEKIKAKRKVKQELNKVKVVKCAKCGEYFETTNARQKYCSDECKKQVLAEYFRKYRNANKDHLNEKAKEYRAKDSYKQNRREYFSREDVKERNRENYRKKQLEKVAKGELTLHEKKCVVCGKIFTTMRPNQITCSDECRTQYNSVRYKWAKKKKQATEEK